MAPTIHRVMDDTPLLCWAPANFLCGMQRRSSQSTSSARTWLAEENGHLTATAWHSEWLVSLPAISIYALIADASCLAVSSDGAAMKSFSSGMWAHHNDSLIKTSFRKDNELHVYSLFASLPDKLGKNYFALPRVLSKTERSLERKDWPGMDDR
jgi:hypothetical protein